MSAEPAVRTQVLFRDCLGFSRHLSTLGPGLFAKLEVKLGLDNFSFQLGIPAGEEKTKKKTPSDRRRDQLRRTSRTYYPAPGHPGTCKTTPGHPGTSNPVPGHPGACNPVPGPLEPVTPFPDPLKPVLLPLDILETAILLPNPLWSQ